VLPEGSKKQGAIPDGTCYHVGCARKEGLMPERSGPESAGAPPIIDLSP
jgi:hypothetical protein